MTQSGRWQMKEAKYGAYRNVWRIRRAGCGNFKSTSALAPIKEHCIVVVDIHGKLTGVIVDSLSWVLTIEEKEFEETLQLLEKIATMKKGEL